MSAPPGWIVYLRCSEELQFARWWRDHCEAKLAAKRQLALASVARRWLEFSWTTTGRAMGGSEAAHSDGIGVTTAWKTRAKCSWYENGAATSTTAAVGCFNGLSR